MWALHRHQLPQEYPPPLVQGPLSRLQSGYLVQKDLLGKLEGDPCFRPCVPPPPPSPVFAWLFLIIVVTSLSLFAFCHFLNLFSQRHHQHYLQAKLCLPVWLAHYRIGWNSVQHGAAFASSHRGCPCSPHCLPAPGHGHPIYFWIFVFAGVIRKSQRNPKQTIKKKCVRKYSLGKCVHSMQLSLCWDGHVSCH